MAFSDASFASQKKPDSHAGLFIVGTHQKISQNLQCPISPVSWGCKKIQKVVTSTLSAETNARRRYCSGAGFTILEPTGESRKRH
jgi:hypothetical protein